MAQEALYLHHDAASAATHRVLKVLALKGMAWRACALEPGQGRGPVTFALDGALGAPVLQRGRDLWVGALAVLDALEALKPEPTIFPNGNRGMPLALGWWSDALAAENDPAQATAHAGLIERQLADGRDFLQGAKPGLADVHCYAGLAASPGAAGGPPASDIVAAWYVRMEALGCGARSDSSREEASAAIAALAATPADAEAGEGQRVYVSAVGGAPGIEGTERTAGPDEIAVVVDEAPFGAVTIHFSAIGYHRQPV